MNQFAAKLFGLSAQSNSTLILASNEANVNNRFAHSGGMNG